MQLETVADLGLTIEQYEAEIRHLNLHRTKVPGLYVCLATGSAHGQTFNVKQADAFDTPAARAEFIEELKLRVSGY